MALNRNLCITGLLLILLAAGVFCVYTVGKYHDSSASGPSTAGQATVSPRQSSRPAGVQPQNPRGFQDQGNAGRTAPNGNAPVQNSGANGSSGLRDSLLIYAAIFLGLCCVAYYLFIYRKLKIDPDLAKILILTLLGAGLLMRIGAATLMSGHPFDINTFRSWAAAAANNLFQVYNGGRTSDYPPLYMYILFVIGKLGSLPALSGYYPLLLKMPSIIADIATSYLIYRLARKYLSLELSILLSSFYLFNPAILINSTFWGQVDSFFTLIVVSSVWALAEKRISLAGVLFTAAVLMKPQGIIFLPVLGFELIRQRKLKSFLKAAAGALATVLLVVLPFAVNHDPLWIFHLYAQTVGEYPYASVNAFNLFSLLGANYKSDAAVWLSFSYHTWGLIFIALVTAYAWFIYIKGNSAAFIPAAALLQIAGVFTLAVSMHERYLFPAAALAILAAIYLRDKRILLLAGGFSTTIFINTHVILFETMQGINTASYSPVMIITSLLNVLLLGYLGKVLFDLAVTHNNRVIKVIDAAAQ